LHPLPFSAVRALELLYSRADLALDDVALEIMFAKEAHRPIPGALFG
jgi:hypothetical protein